MHHQEGRVMAAQERVVALGNLERIVQRAAMVVKTICKVFLLKCTPKHTSQSYNAPHNIFI